MAQPRASYRIERISSGQLFCSLVLFLLGTTWLFVPGATMGRDAWIASAMGVFSGLLLLLLYLRLSALFPQESIAEWLPRLCGPYIGTLLAAIYTLYFLYLCARNLRDIAELLRLSFLNRTPVIAITLLQTCTIGMAAYYGMETSTRLKQLLLPVVLMLLGLTFMGLWAQRYPIHLVPLLEYGAGAVWYHSFPLITTVPYGELIVYLVYLPYVKQNRNKASLWAYAFGGALLILIPFVAILVMGAANLANSALPFYTLIRSLSLGDVLQRLDAVVVPLLAFGAYAKSCSFLIGASYSASQLLGAKRPGNLALAMAVIASGWGTTMATSWGQHLHIGLEIVPFALHIPFQLLVPLALWLWAEIRRRWRPIQRPPRIIQRDVPPAWPSIVAVVIGLLIWSMRLWPTLLELTLGTNWILMPLADWVGEPIVRLLGGHPLKK